MSFFLPKMNRMNRDELKGDLKMKCLCGCGQEAEEWRGYIKGHRLGGRKYSEEAKVSLRKTLSKKGPEFKKQRADRIVKAHKEYLEERKDWGAEKITEYYKSHPEEGEAWVAKVAKYQKEHPEIDAKMMKGIIRDYINVPRLGIEAGRRMKDKCKTQAGFEKQMVAMQKPHQMSSYEKKVSDLIKKYHLPYRWVGNGQFWLGRRNPDFVDEGRKICLEVYATGFLSCGRKPIDYEKRRVDHFARYGYKTCFLTEKDLSRRDWKKYCISKLQD